MRDGSGLRRKIFGFDSRDVGAKSWSNRGADRRCARMPEGSAGTDDAGCALVRPVRSCRNQTSLRAVLDRKRARPSFQSRIERRRVARKPQPQATFAALRPSNCGRINESTRPLTGLGSGEQYESRFHRKCINGGHTNIGLRRGAVGNQDLLRRVNKQETGVEQETSG